jgi:uncharacterized membrane protein YcjF (UPF0283 family)
MENQINKTKIRKRTHFLRILIIFVLFVLFFALLPILFYKIFEINEKSVWLGFWASYISGLCTLIAVVITIIYESYLRKLDYHKLNNQLSQQFERDLDLRRVEKFEDASNSFKIFILKIKPKFKKHNGKIVFNYNEIIDELYMKYSLFKHYYYTIYPIMDSNIKKYFQKTIKVYIEYLDTLRNTSYTELSDMSVFLERINNEYKMNHAQKNKHGFIQLRKDVIEYIQKKYNNNDV